jgi:hypothetical protein
VYWWFDPFSQVTVPFAAILMNLNCTCAPAGSEAFRGDDFLAEFVGFRDRKGMFSPARTAKAELFGLDSTAFFGQLVSLEPCERTVSALAMMRDTPTLCGIVEIYPIPPVDPTVSTEPKTTGPV